MEGDITGEEKQDLDIIAGYVFYSEETEGEYNIIENEN